MAAVLDAGEGAVLSTLAAPALWELPSFSFGEMETTRPRKSRGEVSLSTLHRSRYLPKHHVTVVRRIPCTSVARTLVDIAPALHPERWARLLDIVSGKHPSLLTGVHAAFEELSGRGRYFDPWIVAVLRDRPPGYMGFESGLERRVAEILKDAGEEPMERQVDLGGHEWLGRFDFRDPPPYQWVLEVQSDSFHRSKSDQQDDARRRAGLEAIGIPVREAWEQTIWRRPGEILNLVRKMRRELRAGSIGQSMRTGTGIDPIRVSFRPS
jgi:hypothetical protein